MSIDIKAPAFPESISEGRVAGWQKAVGDRVARDEVLVEIETDKVVLEVVASEDGVLTEILAGDGETVLSEQVIGRFAAGGGAAAPAAPIAPAGLEASAGAGAAAASASPAARQMAEEQGVDIRRVEGSGRSGRITRRTLLAPRRSRLRPRPPPHRQRVRLRPPVSCRHPTWGMRSGVSGSSDACR